MVYLRPPFGYVKVLEEKVQEKGVSTRAMGGSWLSSGVKTETVEAKASTAQAIVYKRRKIIVG